MGRKTSEVYLIIFLWDGEGVQGLVYYSPGVVGAAKR